MKSRRLLGGVSLLAILLVTASACSSKKNPTSSSSGTNSAEAACKADKFGCEVYKSGAPIHIGTLLAISGDVATLGLDSQHGAQLAVDYLDGKFDNHNGSIDGHTIQLVNKDDGCNKDQGQIGATELASDPTILSVIGTSCSSSALGVADKIFSDKGIILISPSNTGPALTAQGTHQPFYLRTAHNDKIQGAVVADFAKQKLGAKTAATIHDDSPYSDGLAAVFREVFQKQGGTITDNQAIQATDRDFKPVLNSIAQHKPDFLYYPAFNPACALIAKQARSIPALNNTKLTGSDGCADPEYVRIGGKDVYGTWDSSPDVTAQTSANAYYGQQFLPAYQKEFGQRPVSVFNAHAWDAAQILFAAIQKVAKNDNGTLTIPRTGLKDAVYQTKDYKGLSGTITCTPLGDCATAVSIAVYKVPAWPIEGGSANPKPVFTETKTLADVASG